MPAPWEKYSTEQGPWSKYAPPAPAAPKDRISQGVEDFDKTKAAFESQPAKSFGESVVDAGKQVGGAVTGLVTGIPDAVREVGNFLSNPNEWAKKHFDPQQANTAPGADGNPVNEAVGLTAAALLPGAKDAIPGPLAPLRTAAKVVTDPAVIRKGINVLPKGPAFLDFIDTIKASAERARTKPPEPPSPVMAPAVTDAPTAAQIPANASPAEIAAFKPQQVMEMMQQAKPVLTVPETPAEAAAMPTKRTRAPKKAAEAMPEVQTIPAPPPKYTAEQFSTPARAAKAGKLADLLHEHGITFEEASGMLPEHWKSVAESAGVNVPSAASVKVALSELQRLEKTSSVVSKNPKALKIAQELADSMMQ